MSFRNAAIGFMVGQEFTTDLAVKLHKRWTVMEVDRNGHASCIADGGGMEVFGPDSLPHCDLDLDSVWIGREYTSKPYYKTVRVVAIGPDHIATSGEDNECWGRGVFQSNFEPLPLPPAPPLPPCPVTIGEFVLIGADKAGRVALIDDAAQRFQISGHGWFKFETEVTRLVPERKA